MSGADIERPRGIIQLDSRINVQRRGRKQARLRPGNLQTLHQRLEGRPAAACGRVGAQRCQLYAAGQLQFRDVDMSVRRRRFEVPVPAALHGDPVPRQVRPRAHRGRLEIEVEITRQVIDIDIAAGAAVQRPGIDRQLQALGRPGAVQVQRRGQRTQSRQLQQVLQRTAGRLIQLQHGIHAFRIELQVQDIVANPAYAVRIHLDDHIGERAQVDCSPQHAAAPARR